MCWSAQTRPRCLVCSQGWRSFRPLSATGSDPPTLHHRMTQALLWVSAGGEQNRSHTHTHTHTQTELTLDLQILYHVVLRSSAQPPRWAQCVSGSWLVASSLPPWVMSRSPAVLLECSVKYKQRVWWSETTQTFDSAHAVVCALLSGVLEQAWLVPVIPQMHPRTNKPSKPANMGLIIWTNYRVSLIIIKGVVSLWLRVRM